MRGFLITMGAVACSVCVGIASESLLYGSATMNAFAVFILLIDTKE